MVSRCALVGKTVMDDPEANPEYYRDASAAQAVADTETLIREVQAIGHEAPQGIWPVVTPRFIPSCTDEVLRGLGEARLSVVEVFWLATAGGGEALGLHVLLGMAQLIDCNDAGTGSVGVKVATGSYDAGTLALPPGTLELIG